MIAIGTNRATLSVIPVSAKTSTTCDREWAVRGPFMDIIASGWHTANLIMRLYGGHYLSSVASLVSLGIDELI